MRCIPDWWDGVGGEEGAPGSGGAAGAAGGAVACAAVVGNATNEAIRTGGGRFGEVGVVIEAVSISKPLAFPLENVTSCSTYT
jgi:hypothetical protein